MKRCPICSTATDKRRAGTPYWECGGCGLLFQDPSPPKLFQHPDEYDLAGLSDGDKAANRQLARWLFEDVLKSTPGHTLDIGAKHPYLARCLQDMGCETYALDHEPALDDLGVTMWRGDFESYDIAMRFDLVTMVHVFEHLYDAAAAMRKLRQIVADTGRVFIRMPDSNVPGIERDFGAQHYAIHPFVHSLSSVGELCAQTKTFVIEWTSELRPGQRDIVLEAIE